MARNSTPFEEKFLPSFHFSAQALGLLPYFQFKGKMKIPRVFGKVKVEKSMAWSFFDGACQSLQSVCGVGFILCVRVPTFSF